jgi:L-ascorbate metabolism protein UlaG (beta-lactamase superfamily)
MTPLLALLLACSGTPTDSAAPASQRVAGVHLTWLGVTTWLMRVDDQAVLFDAYLTRGAPGSIPSSPLAAATLDAVLEAEGLAGLDHVLVGHSHFDHAWDAGAVAVQADAELWGTATTCHIGVAQGLPAERCTVVGDGDRLDLGAIQVEAVRTSHWGPDTPSGAHGTWSAPPDDPADVGLAPHGGVLGFLVEADGRRIFMQDSLGPVGAVDGSGVDFQAAMDRLAAGPTVDVWVGAVSLAESGEALQPYLDALRPTATLAHHWDGVVPDTSQPLTQPFSAPVHVGDALAAADVSLLAPSAYGERILIDDAGLRVASQSPVTAALVR